MGFSFSPIMKISGGLLNSINFSNYRVGKNSFTLVQEVTNLGWRTPFSFYLVALVLNIQQDKLKRKTGTTRLRSSF